MYTTHPVQPVQSEQHITAQYSKEAHHQPHLSTLEDPIHQLFNTLKEKTHETQIRSLYISSKSDHNFRPKYLYKMFSDVRLFHSQT